jgi:transcriptional regulator with XRE-family HTH domain
LAPGTPKLIPNQPSAHGNALFDFDRGKQENGLPLRKVAAVLDIDPSTLSKIERGERSANKEMIPLLAELFKEDIETLGLILLSDKVAYDLRDEENSNEILKVAEEKIKYLKNKSLQQGKIDFDKQ